MSSFQFHCRRIADTELSSKHGKYGQDLGMDLITFLATAQAMGIGILPITWQVERDLLGEGGTSKVTQALVNLQTSFAFKCLSDKQKQEVAEATIFQTLINEVLVLGHPKLQKHPNIVELQGICWDVVSEDEIWPVFVFEKSQFDDLYKFLCLPVGRGLSIVDRLKLCVDIGTAIIDIHSAGKTRQLCIDLG
jgi:hypothetical protein